MYSQNGMSPHLCELCKDGELLSQLLCFYDCYLYDLDDVVLHAGCFHLLSKAKLPAVT